VPSSCLWRPSLGLPPIVAHTQFIVILFIFVVLCITTTAFLLVPLYLILEERLRYYVLGWPTATAPARKGAQAPGFCERAKSELSVGVFVLLILFFLPLIVLFIVGLFIKSTLKVRHLGRGWMLLSSSSSLLLLLLLLFCIHLRVPTLRRENPLPYCRNAPLPATCARCMLRAWQGLHAFLLACCAFTD
jgi:hypothetical protein